ncbi:MAG TPA: alpha/beta hydrolase [Streptosporangiaceae bacterium]|nr:alpha/beta hydrolase [Streptosporangiaceae bacterium]
MRKLLFFVSAGGAVLASGSLARRYRHDLDLDRARLALVGRAVIPTSFGAVEYAERGTGEPLLAIHGIFGGCDSGLVSVDGLFPDRRVIAPSRFGYLGSDRPADATPADQADAFAALLDGLGIERTDVIGFSAGATSALQFGLRHPDRIKHLVVLSGNLPGSPTAAIQPQANRLLVRSEFPMWAVRTFAGPAFARMVGTPRGLPLTAADERMIADVVGACFPVLPRAEGVLFDFFVSNPDVNNYDLVTLMVPTLIVHAKDDPLASYEAARRAAGRIPGARLVSVDRGGHLMLGQQEVVAAELAGFLEGTEAARVATAPGSGAGGA